MNWINTQDQVPLCYETGNWDGKKSDLFIGETMTCKKFLGCCYEGVMDGSKFFDWYQVDEISSNDWSVNEPVVRWLEIPF